MRAFYLVILLSAYTMADKPAVPPSYQAPAAAAPTYSAPKAAAPVADSYGSPAQDSYGSPAQDSYGSPQAAPAASPDSYGSPQAPPQSNPDSYGSPAAPVVDEYGSPAAPAQNNYAAPTQEQAPVGNQGYYYYYYPVKQNGPSYNAPAKDEGDDGGLLGLILSKKVLVIAGVIVGLLVLLALGVNLNPGRSFDSSFLSSSAYDMVEELSAMAAPHMTPGNMFKLADMVQRALDREY